MMVEEKNDLTTGQHEIIESVVLVMLPLDESPGAKEALQTACDLIEQVVTPRTIVRPDRVTPSNPQGKVTVGLNNAQALDRLRKLVKGTGYKPADGDAGTIRDLASDDRLNLVVETAVSLVCGYRHSLQGQTPTSLEFYPCQELYRYGRRECPRDWPKRWEAAGGRIFGVRMIAVKNSPIWTAISAFGLSFPPFDFDSGMGVAPVSRDAAVKLGVITENNGVVAESVRLNLDFRKLLEQRLKSFVIPAGQQEQCANVIAHGTSEDLVRLAEKMLREVKGLTTENAGQIIELIERAIEKASGDTSGRLSSAYGLLADLYDEIEEEDSELFAKLASKAAVYRSQYRQDRTADLLARGTAYELLKLAEEMFREVDELTPESAAQIVTIAHRAIEKGFGTSARLLSNTYGVIADVYEKVHDDNKAAAYREQKLEKADGFTLLDVALNRIKSLDKPVNRETGEKVLKFLTKAVERIPETYPLRLAEAFRAAAEISEALGNKSQAFDYYQLALQKNPKLTIKKRLNALKKELGVTS